MHLIVSHDKRIFISKNFRGHAPGPYQETRGLQPLGTSPPNNKC